MIITPFQLADQPAVSQFWSDIWREMGWSDEIDGNDDMPHFFHFPEGFLFVAKEGEKIVGCAGVKPLSPGIGVLKRFYLDASIRGTGAAQSLLKTMCEESITRGYSKLVLDVYYTNLRAARFYEKNGFQQYQQEPVEDWEETKFPNEFFYYELDLNRQLQQNE